MINLKFKLLTTITALSLFIVAGCNNTGSQQNMANRDTTLADATAVTDTNDVDFNAPREMYKEIIDTTIRVQGNKKYAIYSLSNTVLFDFDQSKLKKTAEAKLKMIGESLNNRFKGANIGIYGHTDSVGSKSYNKVLAHERAAAVRNYLMENFDIPEDKIALISFGEADPATSNITSTDKQKNRSVEIVVTKGLMATYKK